jgi:chaperone BCS1
MTTNHKERLDPALLRPGRIDNSFELNLSSKHQAEMLYKRFFNDEVLARKFG